MSSDEKKSRTRSLNFTARKTEEEWADTLHGLAEDVAATWFKWIGWTFAVGGVAYIADKTGSSIFRGIELFSYVVLYFYFNQFFMSFRIEPYEAWIKSQKTQLRLVLAILPAAALALAGTLVTNRLIMLAIEQIKLTR